MKPTKNRVFCPECRRTKMLFETEEKAERFIKFNKAEMGEYCPVRAYYCVACGGWHTTSHEDYKPGRLDSENIVSAYKQDMDNQLEQRICAIEQKHHVSDIHNFLQRCINGKHPLVLTDEQLQRIKSAYLAADRYPNDGKCRKRVRQMLAQLGAPFTQEELNASDKETPDDEQPSCGSCRNFTNEDIYGSGICNMTEEQTYCGAMCYKYRRKK